MYGNVLKVVWEGKGVLDAILSQINKKIGNRFHFQKTPKLSISNFVTDKVNGSRLKPSLFGEDHRPDPGDGGNRAYHLEVYLNSDLGKYFRNGRFQYSFKHSKTINCL